MKRLVGGALLCLPLLAAGCQALDGVLGAKPAAAPRATGQWQKTLIGFQKYNNALLRDKATGKPLDPEDAASMPLDAYTVEAGDIEELTYRAGRLRYSFTPREADAQPYVVERPIDEKEFEALDAALYQDKFFGMPERNWATDERFPMFYVQYDQSGRGWKASFAPNLNRLVKTGAIVNPYLAQLSGVAKAPAGARQYAYYLVPKGGALTISIATLAANAGGDTEDRPWKVLSATYDAGKGHQAATLAADGKGFTLPLPKGDGTLTLMGLKVTAEGDPGTWETLIPVRTTK